MPRKKASNEQLAVTSEPLSGTSQSSMNVSVNNEAEYDHSEWGGHKHYACKLCSIFDTFDKKSMLEHLIDAHSSEDALNELYGAIKPSPPAPSPEGRGELIEKEMNDGETDFDEDQSAG